MLNIHIMQVLDLKTVKAIGIIIQSTSRLATDMAIKTIITK